MGKEPRYFTLPTFLIFLGAVLLFGGVSALISNRLPAITGPQALLGYVGGFAILASPLIAGLIIARRR